MNETMQYEVALSFAGEEREYVEKVARALQSRGIEVFYDEFEQVSLWGADLVEEFHDVFENRANLAVMFISEHYVEKSWPTHERRSILSQRSSRAITLCFASAFLMILPVPGLPNIHPLRACRKTWARRSLRRLSLKRSESDVLKERLRMCLPLE